MYQDVFEKIQGKRVAVIGDVMVDHHIFGVMNRESQESEQKIFDQTHFKKQIGGAGNVAANIVSLGGEAILFGVPYEFPAHLLTDNRISASFRLEGDFRQAPTKTRFWHECTQGVQIFRHDHETVRPIGAGTAQVIASQFRDLTPEPDAVIFSDYGKGVITPELIEDIYPPHDDVIANPKGDAVHKYQNIPHLIVDAKTRDLICPVDITCGIRRPISDFHEDKVFWVHLTTHGADGVTLSADGVVRYPGATHCGTTHYDAIRVDEIDPCGAGDTFTAAYTLATAGGFSPWQSAEFANVAAGVSVLHRGVYAVRQKDFEYAGF